MSATTASGDPRHIGATTAGQDPYNLGHGHAGRGAHAGSHREGGSAPKIVVTGYGFWIYLLSDIIMFSAFFAAYAVLSGETAGGPSGADLFELWRVAVQTVLLLTSSFTCGLASLATERREMGRTQVWLLVTGLLGAAFILLELQEFAQMIADGAGPGRSAFLSAFYALVGLHGLHVSVGLLWLGTMMAQLWFKGFRPDILRRLLCFNLFWHALDIVWIAVFTIVYLMGAGR
jgi:cytochrome o ubiquinol oxidase subunit III